MYTVSDRRKFDRSCTNCRQVEGYCADLYHDEGGKGTEQEYWEQEPPPLQRLLIPSVRQQVAGLKEVPAELFKAGETVLDRMHRICVTIWETDEWPEEQTFCTFIPLPKKDDIKQCANYRTIARLTCKQNPSSDHTGNDPSEDGNRNCTRTSGIPTRKGDKRPNHKFQNTDAQGTQAPATTL